MTCPFQSEGIAGTDNACMISVLGLDLRTVADIHSPRPYLRVSASAKGSILILHKRVGCGGRQFGGRKLRIVHAAFRPLLASKIFPPYWITLRMPPNMNHLPAQALHASTPNWLPRASSPHTPQLFGTLVRDTGNASALPSGCNVETVVIVQSEMEVGSLELIKNRTRTAPW